MKHEDGKYARYSNVAYLYEKFRISFTRNWTQSKQDIQVPRPKINFNIILKSGPGTYTL